MRIRWGLALLLQAVTVPAARAQVPMGPEFVVKVGAGNYADVASAPDGRFVVVWSDLTGADGSGRGVFGRAFGADGLPRGAEFQVNTYTTGDQTRVLDWASVAFSNSGFVVVWTSYGQDGLGAGVFGQRFDADGTRRGGEFQVNTSTPFNQERPAVAGTPDGRFVVVWRGDGSAPALTDIFGQRYDAAGNRLGGEFVVNAYTTGLQGGLPDVAMDASGNFVAVWDGPAGVYGQRFSFAGNRLGAEFQVTADTSSALARIAAASDGRFVVLWLDRQDGSENGLAAQRFDASGTRLGAELRVNSYTTGQQFPHSVTLDAHGRITVVWDSYSVAAEQVFARQFDGQGQPESVEFAVSRPPFFGNTFPSVSAAPPGNFVVAWQGYDGYQFAIRARRYYGGIAPTALAMDPASTPDSDGNGVLEACETVEMKPSWRNLTEGIIALGGILTDLTGPPGATYTLADGMGSYGFIGPGSTQACTDCYAVGVSCASPRPVQHWDASALELHLPQTKRWSLHIGESFADVPRSNPFYRFVETLLHQGVTSGCGGTQFCPASPTTREQVAVFVLRAKEGPAYVPLACPPQTFSDVPPSSPFCRWIQELVHRGVVSGCGGGRYCPQDPVTREQMAVILLRTLDPLFDPPACGTPVFNDVPASSPFCRWIEELARRGVTGGCGGGKYCPTAPVTREQMAVFVGATFGLTLYGPTP